MLIIYRCRICGDPFLAMKPPSNCPFCGAPGKYIIEARNWDFPSLTLEQIELNEKSKDHLIRTRQMKIDSSNFFLSIKNKTRNPELYSYFSRLSKIDHEHAELISKTLGVEKPRIEELECSESEVENIKETIRRHNRVINYYSLALSEVIEPRIREIYTALLEIEKLMLEKTQSYHN
jgi:rRNA maturation endonuclease Nob1